MSYYDRAPAQHLDGTPIFKTAADESSEQHVAQLIESRWGCALHSFGRLSPVDWYAERDGRLVGLLELKTRSHKIGTYPTVFLNVRKYLALQLGAVGLGVPALFVVRWTDALRWVEVASVDASSSTIGGCLRVVKSRNDVEPVIEVPVGAMREVA